MPPSSARRERDSPDDRWRPAEKNMKKRLAIEAIAIVAAMTALWAIIYGPWETAPSLVVEEALLYLILVAGFIDMYDRP